MKTRYKWIYFRQLEGSSLVPKTQVWECRNEKVGNVLGVVEWYPRWNQYCYFPVNSTSVYSQDCLEDIVDFIKQLKEGRE